MFCNKDQLYAQHIKFNIYIYIFNILHNLTFSLQKKKTCPSKALSMHTIFSIHVYRFHCGKKCFNVICMYKTTY